MINSVNDFIRTMRERALNAVPKPVDSRYTVKIAEECRAEQEKNFSAFEQLFREIHSKLNTSNPEYLKKTQYLWIYNMIVANTLRNHMLRMVRMLKTPVFKSEFIQTQSAQAYDAMMAATEKQLDTVRKHADECRAMFLYCEHRALAQRLEISNKKASDKDAKQLIKKHMKKTVPGDLWKVSNHNDMVRQKIREVAVRQK